MNYEQEQINYPYLGSSSVQAETCHVQNKISTWKYENVIEAPLGSQGLG